MWRQKDSYSFLVMLARRCWERLKRVSVCSFVWRYLDPFDSHETFWWIFCDNLNTSSSMSMSRPRLSTRSSSLVSRTSHPRHLHVHVTYIHVHVGAYTSRPRAHPRHATSTSPPRHVHVPIHVTSTYVHVHFHSHASRPRPRRIGTSTFTTFTSTFTSTFTFTSRAFMLTSTSSRPHSRHSRPHSRAHSRHVHVPAGYRCLCVNGLDDCTVGSMVMTRYSRWWITQRYTNDSFLDMSKRNITAVRPGRVHFRTIQQISSDVTTFVFLSQKDLDKQKRFFCFSLLRLIAFSEKSSLRVSFFVSSRICCQNLFFFRNKLRSSRRFVSSTMWTRLYGICDCLWNETEWHRESHSVGKRFLLFCDSILRIRSNVFVLLFEMSLVFLLFWRCFSRVGALVVLIRSTQLTADIVRINKY